MQKVMKKVTPKKTESVFVDRLKSSVVRLAPTKAGKQRVLPNFRYLAPNQAAGSAGVTPFALWRKFEIAW